uniref:Uncharacterized protein n=1 Tax=Parastrongyloides trichosuri TaxID=131310 RepID=A0A0N4ZUH2_PARTI
MSKSLSYSIICLLLFIDTSYCQLAAVYDGATRTNECSSWSSWGPCIFPSKQSPVPYLKQLTPLCQKHWFYQFISQKYAPALNSFMNYMADIMIGDNACGLCSYKQSCGYGGKRQCNTSPFAVKGGRSLMPFYVAENVCNTKDLHGKHQKTSCIVNYNKVLENGGECKLWPTPKVNLSSIEPAFQEHVKNLQWYSCLPQIVKNYNGEKPRIEKVCRCCCFPYQPNPITYMCEKMNNMPDAPGSELL